MPGLLHERVAVITGAAQGIGRSVAERYAEQGARVVIADIDYDKARSTADALNDQGHSALAVAADVTSERSVRDLVTSSIEAFSRIDIVVANAGVLLAKEVVDTSTEEWLTVLGVNLTGVFLTCREFSRHLISQGDGGRIIVASSLFGVRGAKDNGGYSATKFGVVGLAQCMAAELAVYGILVNAVCPGQVESRMMSDFIDARANVRGQDSGTVAASMERQIPLGRRAAPAEIADVYLFLASDMSSFITGQAFVVDGGQQVG